MSGSYICPVEFKWMEIHKRLCDHAVASGRVGMPEPPLALVMALWKRTTENEKMVRWQETIKWARQYDCLHLIPELKDAEAYAIRSA